MTIGGFAPLRSAGEIIWSEADSCAVEPSADLLLGDGHENWNHPELTEDKYGQWRMQRSLWIGGRYITRLRNATVFVGRHGNVHVECGGRFLDHVTPPGDRVVADPSVRDGIRWEKGPTLLNQHTWEGNYYHRWLDIEPRLGYAREKLPGYDLTRLGPRSVTRFDELIVPSFWPSRGFSPEPVQWLATKLSVGDFPAARPLCLWLTRRDAKTRRCVNERLAQIHLQLVWKLEIIEIDMGLLPTSSQQHLMRHAKLVIAPHGAALTNLLWGKELAVIELSPSGYQQPCFWFIAKWLGHWYARVLCTSLNDQHDMHVDLETLDHAVEMALKEAT